ncbi:prepilin peptidase [Sporolactobacillus sp. CPB3-1]|uniref:Prepilin peptidase n=1 Tax=Sporolactobacillus mangiferae TaxID=2940498 RepID=A0ABT0M6K9_9BACL|nr:A24 family peptidase [Sporolactobacillus mangiferae]MCL1630474.1 prepilin peptidase [Sporolactobacillus mangiferae]
MRHPLSVHLQIYQNNIKLQHYPLINLKKSSLERREKMSSPLISIYAFFAGITFGSFFNVVGNRMLTDESIVFPRSRCPNCHYPIQHRDLIPIFSFLLLKGKCRHCKVKISFLYPIIEASTGFAFLLASAYAVNLVTLAAHLLLISFVMIAVVTDLIKMIIPDKLILFFLIVFSGYRMIFTMQPWWDSILGGTLIFLFLSFIAFLSKGGIGGGDIKLLAAAGILVGTKIVFIGFIMALFAGTITCIIARMLHMIHRKQAIPFAPFIAIGMISSLFWGEYIFSIYKTLFLNGHALSSF